MDFTSLEKAKEYLRIKGNSDDVLISRLISAASKLMKTYMNRDIEAKDYTEIFDGKGNGFHVFGNYPVNSVSFVYAGSLSVMPAIEFNSAGYVYDDEKVVLNGNVFPRGMLNCKVVYNAGFTTIPDDLEQACCELVSIKYKQIEHIDQQSKVVAGENVSFIVKDIPSFIKIVLNNYKKVISY